MRLTCVGGGDPPTPVNGRWQHTHLSSLSQVPGDGGGGTLAPQCVVRAIRTHRCRARMECDLWVRRAVHGSAEAGCHPVTTQRESAGATSHPYMWLLSAAHLAAQIKKIHTRF